MSWHSAAIHLLRRLRTEDRAAGIGPAQLFHTKTVLNESGRFAFPCLSQRPVLHFQPTYSSELSPVVSN